MLLLPTMVVRTVLIPDSKSGCRSTQTVGTYHVYEYYTRMCVLATVGCNPNRCVNASTIVVKVGRVSGCTGKIHVGLKLPTTA